MTFRKEQCMMCLRCLHHCPVNAIRFKNKDKGQYRRLL
ncbi:4Fe-4S binding protein [Catenibacterium mitsuokai]